jgi:very-short-patch-repair endonuclease
MPNHRRTTFDRARSQAGLVTTSDLRSLDVPPGVRRAMLADGSLRPLSRGVYLVGGVEANDLILLHAATLATGAPASHRSAAWLHGLPGFPAPPRHEVLRLGRDRPHDNLLATIHTTTALPRHDLTVVRGVPCIGVARTLMTLASLVPEVSADRVRGAVDDAVRMGLARDVWLWWRLEQLRCRGRNGVALIEEILAARAEHATESWLERELLSVLREAGVPLPVCQARIAAKGAFVARVDFVYAVLGIVIEVSGAVAHASAEQRARDARRRNRLLIEGYLVLEFTYEHLVREPQMVVEAVLEAVQRRAAA